MTSPHEVSKDVIIVGSGAGKAQQLLNSLDCGAGMSYRDLVFVTEKHVEELPDGIIIWDEVAQYDKLLKAHLGPNFVFSDNCRPYYEETARESRMFELKMQQDMPVKYVDYGPPHKPGETPRGTKPSWVGGVKKTKQQRAAIKARRKQR